MKQIMFPSMSLLFSSALETKKISRLYLAPNPQEATVILPCIVQRIKKEHCHLSDFLGPAIWFAIIPSGYGNNILTHECPVPKPCLTTDFTKHRGCTQGFSGLIFCNLYDLFLCTNATSFNWHLLSASWVFWLDVFGFFVCHTVLSGCTNQEC